MLSYKDVQAALHKWAYRFENDQFEHWDLISAVWVKGDVQQLNDIKLASNRIKWDMIDYMRQVTQFRTRKRNDASGRFMAKTVSLNTVITEKGNEIQEVLCVKNSIPSENLERKDFLDWLLKGCSYTQKLIILLVYVEGFTFKQAGKIVGLSESGTWRVHHVLLKMLRSRLVNSGFAIRKTNETGSTLDYRREYNRLYAQTHKVQIKTRRKQLKKKRAALAVSS